MKLRLPLLLLLTLWCWTEADATTPSPLDEAAIEQNDATRDKRYPFWSGKICNKQCEGSKEANCAGKCRATRSVYREWRLVYDACMKNDNCAEWIPGCMPKCRSEANAAHPGAFGKKIRNFYMEWRLVYDGCMKNDNCAEWIPGCMPKCRSEANAAHPGAFDKKKRDATLDATREKRDATLRTVCEHKCEGDQDVYCVRKCRARVREAFNQAERCLKACELKFPLYSTKTKRLSCYRECWRIHQETHDRFDATRREKRGVCEHRCADDNDADCIQKCKARLREAQDIARRRRASEETVQSPELIQCKKDCAWDWTWICEEQNCMHLERREYNRKRDATREATREKRGVCEHRCADDNDADCIQKCKARLREAHDIGSRR